MKSLRIALSLSLLLAATAALSQTSAQKSFDQLKSLTGSWEGKNSEGKALKVSFRDTAGGSALMSEIEGQGHEDMISMIHLDGANRLVMTHYCGAGNQPAWQPQLPLTARPSPSTSSTAPISHRPTRAICAVSCSLSSMPTTTPRIGPLPLARAKT
jgi:hypothetical protein